MRKNCCSKHEKNTSYFEKIAITQEFPLAFPLAIYWNRCKCSIHKISDTILYIGQASVYSWNLAVLRTKKIFVGCFSRKVGISGKCYDVVRWCGDTADVENFTRRSLLKSECHTASVMSFVDVLVDSDTSRDSTIVLSTRTIYFFHFF